MRYVNRDAFAIGLLLHAVRIVAPSGNCQEIGSALDLVLLRTTYLVRLVVIYDKDRSETVLQVPHNWSRSTSLIQDDDALDIVLLYQLLDSIYLVGGVYVGPLG